MPTAVENQNERAFYTPPELAKRWRIDPAKVIAWIKRGELVALNVASTRTKRPLYRISRSAVDDFENGRVVSKPARNEQPRRRELPKVKQYF